jgi:hypothetical protein
MTYHPRLTVRRRLPNTRPVKIPYMFSLYLVPRLAVVAGLYRRRTMASLVNRSSQSQTAVSIAYPSLLSAPSSLSHSIGNVSVASKCLVHNSSTDQAFGSGPHCLGIIIVRDLPPEYPKLRERLLKLAHAFSQLDEPVREKYADAKSRYRFEPSLTFIIV